MKNTELATIAELTALIKFNTSIINQFRWYYKNVKSISFEIDHEKEILKIKEIELIDQDKKEGC